MSAIMLNCQKLSIIICIFRVIFAQNVVKDLNITNNGVSAIFDLNGALLRVEYTIIFSNNGMKPISHYFFTVNEPQAYLIQFFNKHKERLQYRVVSNEPLPFINVTLDREISQGELYQLEAHITYANSIVSASKTRKIDEQQLMKYEGNLLFISPFDTVNYFAKYRLKNSSIIDLSHLPTEANEEEVIYDLKTLGNSDNTTFKIAFISNLPFITVKSLERTIFVSHYGMILIEDKVSIENYGPKLSGNFRLLGHGFKQLFRSYLPVSAQHIKYFDDLGNNDFMVRYYDNYIRVSFKTRYPLFGGWKTNYILQYAVPTYECLEHSSNTFLLKIKAVDHVLGGVIEDVKLAIVLPEGAHIRNLHKPNSISFVAVNRTGLGGLSLNWRPVITFSGKFVFAENAGIVLVQYDYNPINMLIAPAVIIWLLFILHTLVKVIVIK